MPDDTLSEAYVRLEDTGPEWGEDHLTNHGPMAVEVMVRRGYATTVTRWLDRYSARLEELPRPNAKITDSNWQQAWGDGRRLGDWTTYFDQQLSEQPWRNVLHQWWPRLRPGILAGTTHGVIRVSHAVRALLAGPGGAATVTELGRGLAFWAARMQPLISPRRLVVSTRGGARPCTPSADVERPGRCPAGAAAGPPPVAGRCRGYEPTGEPY